MEKYQHQALEIKRIRSTTRVKVILIVIGSLGTMSGNGKAWYGRLNLADIFGSAQLSTILDQSYRLHASSTYLRLISASGAVFTINLQIYLETSSPQRENDPKLPGVLRLLLRKTGHWPVASA